MSLGKCIFSQLLVLVDRYEFKKCVKCYNGGY